MANKSTERPEIRSLSRRQFLALTGATAGVMGSAVLAETESPQAPSKRPAAKPAPRRVNLPDLPNHNPGFWVQTVADGGVVLWTNRTRGGFRGYRLNVPGKVIWESCDGQHSPEEIAKAYARQTRRDEKETPGFLKELRKAGIVVSGGYINAAGGFPIATEGAGYRPRLDRRDVAAG
ncbi:MAG: PqqD family protein [Candidatus Hydrogenedentes bacterium]|nr:PqqD family protein [Candidatus Hydrogenedentota bacterium]